jgi:hypothetical protein
MSAGLFPFQDQSSNSSRATQSRVCQAHQNAFSKTAAVRRDNCVGRCHHRRSSNISLRHAYSFSPGCFGCLWSIVTDAAAEVAAYNKMNPYDNPLMLPVVAIGTAILRKDVDFYVCRSTILAFLAQFRLIKTPEPDRE